MRVTVKGLGFRVWDHQVVLQRILPRIGPGRAFGVEEFGFGVGELRFGVRGLGF